MKTYPMLIGGETVLSSQSIDVVNPATGQTIARVPEADASAVQSALEAAEEGFKGPSARSSFCVMPICWRKTANTWWIC